MDVACTVRTTLLVSTLKPYRKAVMRKVPPHKFQSSQKCGSDPARARCRSLAVDHLTMLHARADAYARALS